MAGEKAAERAVILFHHDPTHSDAELERILADATAYQSQDVTRPACEVLIAYEELELELTPERYATDIAPARTFGFSYELDQMRNMGLIRGASLENAVCFDRSGVMLRWLFENHPSGRYRLLIARDAAGPSGYVIWRVCRGSGNRLEGIAVTGGVVTAADTWPNFGQPYVVLATVTVADSTNPLLVVAHGGPTGAHTDGFKLADGGQVGLFLEQRPMWTLVRRLVAGVPGARVHRGNDADEVPVLRARPQRGEHDETPDRPALEAAHGPSAARVRRRRQRQAAPARGESVAPAHRGRFGAARRDC